MRARSAIGLYTKQITCFLRY